MRPLGSVGTMWGDWFSHIFFFPKTGRHGSVRKTPAANRTLTDLQVDYFFWTCHFNTANQSTRGTDGPCRYQAGLTTFGLNRWVINVRSCKWSVSHCKDLGFRQSFSSETARMPCSGLASAHAGGPCNPSGRHFSETWVLLDPSKAMQLKRALLEGQVCCPKKLNWTLEVWIPSCKLWAKVCTWHMVLVFGDSKTAFFHVFLTSKREIRQSTVRSLQNANLDRRLVLMQPGLIFKISQCPAFAKAVAW